MGFMTGQKIYENFVNGAGADGLSGGAAIVNEVASGYTNRAQQIRELIVEMEAAWQGTAAGAAQRGAGPLALEHELATANLRTTQDLTSRQAGSFGHARNAVMPVPPEPTKPDPFTVFRSPGDVATYQQQVMAYNAAVQHNVDVMSGYADASNFNAREMPRSYGSLTSDQAGIAVDSGRSTSSGPPDASRPTRSEGAPKPASGPVWPGPGGSASGEPGSSGGPVRPGGGEQVPQQTTPGGFTPVPGGPIPVGGGGGPVSGSPAGGPGVLPGAGSVPVGGGLTDADRLLGGGRDPSAGPGRRGGPGGIGGPGSPGGESGGRGPGAGGRIGDPSGPGGRAGGGPLAGGPVGAGGRLAAGAGGHTGGGTGGVPVGAGGYGRNQADLERRAPEYLRVRDPEGLFGTDELTAPSVIGEDLDSAENA